MFKLNFCTEKTSVCGHCRLRALKKVWGEVNDCPTKLMLNTGAQVSVMSEESEGQEAVGPTHENCCCGQFSAGCCKCDLTLGNEEVRVYTYILKHLTHSFLLAQDTLDALEAIVDLSASSRTYRVKLFHSQLTVGEVTQKFGCNKIGACSPALTWSATVSQINQWRGLTVLDPGPHFRVLASSSGVRRPSQDCFYFSRRFIWIYCDAVLGSRTRQHNLARLWSKYLRAAVA